MIQLGDVIISNNLSTQNKCKKRIAARAIICSNDKVLLIHSKFYNDYTFPGGGVESNESDFDALVRECHEEAGALISEIKPFCITVEKCEIDADTYLEHESHFYLCKKIGDCSLELEDYEVKLGYEPVWLSIDEAIKYNETKKNSLKGTDYSGVLERELRVLYYLKEN